MKLFCLTKRCAVQGCENGKNFTGDNLNKTFFDIPTNHRNIGQWLAVTSDDGNRKICEDHFTEQDIFVDQNQKKYLNPDAIPTQHLPQKICRTCVQPVHGDGYYTPDSVITLQQGITTTLRDLLKYCVIAIDKIKIPNPVICQSCYEKLHVCYLFKFSLVLKLDRTAAIFGKQQNIANTTCYTCNESVRSNFKTVVPKTPVGSCLKKILRTIPEHIPIKNNEYVPVICKTCHEMLNRIVAFKKQIKKNDQTMTKFLKDKANNIFEKEAGDLLQTISHMKNGTNTAIVQHNEEKIIKPFKISTKNMSASQDASFTITPVPALSCTPEKPKDASYNPSTITPVPALLCATEMKSPEKPTSVHQNTSPKKYIERKEQLRWSKKEKEIVFENVKKSIADISFRGMKINWQKVMLLCRQKNVFANESEFKNVWTRMKTAARATKEFKRTVMDKQILKFLRDNDKNLLRKQFKLLNSESDMSDSRESSKSGYDADINERTTMPAEYPKQEGTHSESCKLQKTYACEIPYISQISKSIIKLPETVLSISADIYEVPSTSHTSKFTVSSQADSLSIIKLPDTVSSIKSGNSKIPSTSQISKSTASPKPDFVFPTSAARQATSVARKATVSPSTSAASKATVLPSTSVASNATVSLCTSVDSQATISPSTSAASKATVLPSTSVASNATVSLCTSVDSQATVSPSTAVARKAILSSPTSVARKAAASLSTSVASKATITPKSSSNINIQRVDVILPSNNSLAPPNSSPHNNQVKKRFSLSLKKNATEKRCDFEQNIREINSKPSTSGIKRKREKGFKKKGTEKQCDFEENICEINSKPSTSGIKRKHEKASDDPAEMGVSKKSVRPSPSGIKADVFSKKRDDKNKDLKPVSKFDEKKNIVKISIPFNNIGLENLSKKSGNKLTTGSTESKQYIATLLKGANERRYSEEIRKIKEKEERILNNTSTDVFVSGMQELITSITDTKEQPPCTSKDVAWTGPTPNGNTAEHLPIKNNEVEPEVGETDQQKDEPQTQDDNAEKEQETQSNGDEDDYSSDEESDGPSHMSKDDVEKMFNIDVIKKTFNVDPTRYSFNVGLIKDVRLEPGGATMIYDNEVIVIDDDSDTE